VDDFYINKVLNGDTNAFKYFVETYKDFAFSLAYSILKNEYLAEESVQESFIKAYDKLSSFNYKAKFKTWLGRIVINESLRKINKKNQPIENFDSLSETEIAKVDDAMNKLLIEERQFYINLIFENLNHEESLVLELFYLKEYSIKQICSMTGWSDSKVKMLNLRGRQSFYVRLKHVLKSEIRKIL